MSVGTYINCHIYYGFFGTKLTQAMETACEYLFENEKVKEDGKILV